MSKTRNYKERQQWEMYNKQEKEESICRNCEKDLKTSHNGLQCDLCDQWFHCGCEKVSAKDYKLPSFQRRKLNAVVDHAALYLDHVGP